MKGTVRALFVKPRKGVRSVPLETVAAVAAGFDGDHHTRSTTSRQILMISSGVLNQLEIEPGDVSENVVVEGMDVMALLEGQQLRLGGALVEVTIPCEPCSQMDRVRKGLRGALENRRGMFVKVVSAGNVRLGDAVEVV